VAKVKVIPQDRSLPVVGTLLPKREATIGAQVEGQVEKTSVDFGDRIRKGQELATIDTESYESLARQAEANLAKARANALNAEQNLKRVLELQKSSIASASEMDLATAQAEQARAEVRSAEAAEAIAQLDLRHSRATAPFDGAVAQRIANLGDYVKTGAPLFRVVDDTELKFLIQAPERYAGQVKEGQTVQFSVDAWPQNNSRGSGPD
jgi:HlyD family secretion protein